MKYSGNRIGFGRWSGGKITYKAVWIDDFTETLLNIVWIDSKLKINYNFIDIFW